MSLNTTPGFGKSGMSRISPSITAPRSSPTGPSLPALGPGLTRRLAALGSTGLAHRCLRRRYDATRAGRLGAATRRPERCPWGRGVRVVGIGPEPLGPVGDRHVVGEDGHVRVAVG